MGLNLKPTRHARTTLISGEGGKQLGKRPWDKENSPSVDNADFSTSVVPLDTVSKKILNARDNRRSLEIQNKTTGAIYVNVDGPADENLSYTVAPGGAWAPPKAPKGEIHIMGSYEDQNVFVAESWA